MNDREQGGEGPGGRHGRRRPPREAVDACQGKSAGTACNFQSPRGAESGTCFTPGGDAPVACRPERPGPGKGGGANAGESL